MENPVLSASRPNVYRSITEKIAKAIEVGAARYQMPWHRVGPSVARPLNVVSQNAYRGVNVVALWADATLRGFSSNYWATYRQWRTLGAQVRKGEKGSVIVFYKKAEPEEVEGAGEDSASRPKLIARASWVFNATQVDGWLSPEAPEPNLIEVLHRADDFVQATGAEIHEGGNVACYRPHADYIQMPPQSAFVGTETMSATEGYYATLLHELTHWTGHPRRLGRDFSGRFGEEAYAMEELVAELGAAFLCADLEVTNAPRPDHAAYVGSWLKVLHRDPKALFTASSKASAAAEYLACNTVTIGPL
jgi:antirestriction protein ArdC